MDRGRGGRGGQDRGWRGGRGGGRSFDRGSPRGGFRGSGDRPPFRGDRGRGGRGSGRGGGGGRGLGFKGGNRTGVEPHRFPGVFIAHSKGDVLCTRNLNPGKAVYGEKLISVTTGDDPIEYREWNPYRSKIGACVICGFDKLGIKPGATVLYLGAASGTTVSHVSDIVGSAGRVFGVEFSPRVGREFVNLAKSRANIVPIIEDARHPQKYRMIVPMVDCLFADVAQPDQARLFALNAEMFLKNNGYFMICIKASCVDSTIPAAQVFESEQQFLVEKGFKPEEQVDLNEFHRGHTMFIGTYRVTK
jgi:rRNA 2'-O-methyltransferase fibrillarin